MTNNNSQQLNYPSPQSLGLAEFPVLDKEVIKVWEENINQNFTVNKPRKKHMNNHHDINDVVYYCVADKNETFDDVQETFTIMGVTECKRFLVAKDSSGNYCMIFRIASASGKSEHITSLRVLKEWGLNNVYTARLK